MEQLLAELIPLAAQRGGGLTWEYYFNFDGGKPPWTSAMSQATGLEALSRAYQATGNQYYLSVAGAGAAGVHRRTAGRCERQDGARHAVSPVHVRAARLDHQRFPADADRPAGLCPCQRQPGGAAAVQRRQRRGDGRGSDLRHRRLVAVSARRRGRPQLPRAGNRLPATALHVDRRAGLLHNRPALPVVPEDAAGAEAADIQGTCARSPSR